MYRVTTRLAAQHHQPADLDLIRAHQADFAKAVAQQDALAYDRHQPRLSRQHLRGGQKFVFR